MIGEINRDFYCLAGIAEKRECVNDLCTDCICFLRKWPTPQQFKEEYGFDYPDDAAVYYREPAMTIQNTYLGWSMVTLDKARDMSVYFKDPNVQAQIVCACTPWGKPPVGWRPQ